MATPKWLQDVMKQSAGAKGRAKSKANAPTKKELQKANKQAKDYLTNIGLTMIPVGLIGTKVGQALAKGYGKAIGEGITNTLQRGGSSNLVTNIPRKKNLNNFFTKLPITKTKIKDGIGKDGYNTIATTMTPQKYLALAKTANYLKDKKSQKKVKEIADLISGTARGKAGKDAPTISGASTAPLFMVEATKKGLQITGHEGRHRAMAAQKLGAKKIPVELYIKNVDKFTGVRKKVKNKINKTLIGEEGSSARRFERRYGKNVSAAQRFKKRVK